MFHLLGNLFFGNRSNESGSQTVDEFNNNNNSFNNNLNTNEASTQTISSNNLVNSNNLSTQQKNAAKVEESNEYNTHTEAATNSSNRGDLDWVIVDRSEEADKLNRRSIGTSSQQHNNIAEVGVNTSMICDNSNAVSMAYATIATQETSAQNGALETKEQQAEQDEEDDNNETLLGSFFERNEVDRPRQEEMVVEEEEFEVKQKDWLITPLPCLTSITRSQRSIIENHPFENLLIEHPSMSVFVSATSSNSASNDDVISKDDVTPAKKCEEQSLAKSACKAKRPSAAQVDAIKKSQSEKRKEESNVNQVSPVQTRQNKKGRKHKKSTSSSSSSSSGSTSDLTQANKENMQVKSMLAQQSCNKLGLSNAIASSKQFDCSHISKKNQMNRYNKLATFSSIKNVNNKHQRKFHKLQQPASSYNFSAQCF